MLSIRHKLVFIGDPGTGKTSVLNRLITNTFNENYDPTIGVDFYTKTIKYQETIFKLQLWDTAGMEKYKSLIPSYVKGSSIIFLLYDISDAGSFESIPRWISFIKENINFKKTKVIILGNKVDLNARRKVKANKAEEIAKNEGFKFFEVSAKSSENLFNAFYNAITELDFFNDLPKGDKLIQELMQENQEDLSCSTTKNNDSMAPSKDESNNPGINCSNKPATQEPIEEKKKKCGC